MPQFEFLCTRCKNSFDVILNGDYSRAYEVQVCPLCDGKARRKRVQLPASRHDHTVKEFA